MMPAWPENHLSPFNFLFSFPGLITLREHRIVSLSTVADHRTSKLLLEISINTLNEDGHGKEESLNYSSAQKMICIRLVSGPKIKTLI